MENEVTKEREVITDDNVGSVEDVLGASESTTTDEESNEAEKPAKVKTKRKYKKKKTVESFQGKIGSNWGAVREFMQENKIRYTTPGLNAKVFVVQESKVSVKDAKELLLAKFTDYI